MTKEVEGNDENSSGDDDSQIFKGVSQLDLEAGSGASFEQYFRWADPEEITDIVRKLKTLELNKVAKTTELAIEIAFPDGVPVDALEKEKLTFWSPHQEEKLDNLYKLYEGDFHKEIADALAKIAGE